MRKITYKNKIGFPPTICIALLNCCNLTCLCCRSNSSSNETRCLRFNDIESLFNRLSEYGQWRISITGGEPLLWKELPQLIELLYKLRFPFSVTTNGSCSANIITSMPSCFWANGVIHVSIDGDRETHNYLRGHHAFENAISFIEGIENAVSKIAINTVLFTNPEIWAKDLLSILLQRKIHHWSIISPVRNGRWNAIDQKLCTTLTYEKQFKFIEDMVQASTQSMPVYKWDFAGKENVFCDTVFIGVDGNIRLPGYYQEDKDYPARPLSKIINIKDTNASTEIANSVLNYLESEKYIL